MGDTYIINKTGDKVAQAIENALQIDDKLSEQKIIIDQEIQRVESIAKGRATGYVFDTKEDMDEWLSNKNNCSTLVLGDNFYIRGLDVPDYWWDGAIAQELETQKVDLSEYVKVENVYSKEESDELFQGKLTDEQLTNIDAVTNKESKITSDLRYYYGTENITPTPESCFTYTDNGDGTCTITGWTDEFSSVVDCVIPYQINSLKVTRIGFEAFSSQGGLKSVIMPNSITYLGGRAFTGCHALSKVKLSESLVDIGCYDGEGVISERRLPSFVFEGTAIAEIEIPESVSAVDTSIVYDSSSQSGIDNYCFSKITILSPETQLLLLTGFTGIKLYCSKGSKAEESFKEMGLKDEIVYFDFDPSSPVKYAETANSANNATNANKANSADTASIANRVTATRVFQSSPKIGILKIADMNKSIFCGFTAIISSQMRSRFYPPQQHDAIVNFALGRTSTKSYDSIVQTAGKDISHKIFCVTDPSTNQFSVYYNKEKGERLSITIINPCPESLIGDAIILTESEDYSSMDTTVDTTNAIYATYYPAERESAFSNALKETYTWDGTSGIKSYLSDISPIPHKVAITITNADGTAVTDYTGLYAISMKDDLITVAEMAPFDENGIAYLSSDKLSIVGVATDATTVWSSSYVNTIEYNRDINKAIETYEKSENKGVPDGYAPLDSAGKIPNEFLYGQTVKEYGVRWKGTSSTVCERLGDAVGLVANAQLGVVSTVQNDFDNIYPWSEMRLCNLDAEGNILAYAGEPSFTRDGTNGDVMVQIPKFYYKREKTAEGYEEWWICAVKLPGYELHPVFMDDGKEVSAVFHSAYNASVETLEDGTTKVLRSISGVQPAVRIARATFRTRAKNKGTGWCIEDIACVNALQMLYMVEYASTNSQAKLGSGVSSLNYAATHLAVEAGENTNEFVTTTATADKYRVGERIEIGTSQGNNNKTSTPRTITAITARDDDADISVIAFDGDPVASIAVGNMIWNVAPLNGSCDELNGGSGYIGTSGRADSAYRGIEGFHGKLFRFIDDVNIKDHLVHYANSIADYADGVYDGKYRAVGYTNGTANGYISEFGYDEKAPWVMFPTKATGGSTTYVPDYYYQNTGERLLALGGNFSSGADDGVFCFTCIGAFSHTSLSCGAHLLIKKP